MLHDDIIKFFFDQILSGRNLVGDRILFKEWQNLSVPTPARFRGKLLAADPTRREVHVRRIKVDHCQTKLPNVVGTLRSSCSFANRLRCRQQHRDQDTDDGDHHQKLDQRKRLEIPTCS